MGSPQRTPNLTAADVTVRPLVEADLGEAERIVRLAFGTYLGMPDPMTFMADGNITRSRWLADPTAAFGAFAGGELVGSVFATNWGSVSFFGPISVRPDLWNQGIAARLLEPVMERFEQWGTTVGGLCTFPNSVRHIWTYQRFGFWPRTLTILMVKPIAAPAAPSAAPPIWSALVPDQRQQALAACRDLTSDIYPGFDLAREIRAIDAHQLGDTILLWDERDCERLAGVAICHCGAGGETTSGTCYIKCAVTRPGSDAAKNFDHLLDACESFASARGLVTLEAGMNTARHEGYQRMLANGFRPVMTSLIMQRHNVEGYNRPGVYLIDDWR